MVCSKKKTILFWKFIVSTHFSVIIDVSNVNKWQQCLSVQCHKTFFLRNRKNFYNQRLKVFFYLFWDLWKKLSFNFLLTFSLRVLTGTYGKLFLCNRKNFYNWRLKVFIHYETFEKKNFCPTFFWHSLSHLLLELWENYFYSKFNFLTHWHWQS